MGNNCMYSKVRYNDLYLYIPEGIITVQDSVLCLVICDPNRPYIPEGIITVRDSDLCHVICDPNRAIYTRIIIFIW